MYPYVCWWIHWILWFLLVKFESFRWHDLYVSLTYNTCNIYFCLLRTGVYAWEQQLILHVWPRFGSPRARVAMLLYRLLAPQWEIHDLRRYGAPDWTAFGRKVRGKGGMARHGMEPEDVRTSLGCPNPPWNPWIHIDVYDLYTVPMCFLQPIQDMLIYSSGSFFKLYLFPPSIDKAGIWGVEPPWDWWCFPRWWSTPWGPGEKMQLSMTSLMGVGHYLICGICVLCPRLVGRCYVGYRQVDPHNDVHLDFILWFLELINIMCQTR